MSKIDSNPLIESTVMRSSNNVLKLCFIFDLDSSSVGLMLDIIAFLLCLAREDCFTLPISFLFSDIDGPLNSSSSRALASERSEVPPSPSIISCPESSPDPSRSPWLWWSSWISVYTPSSKGFGCVAFVARPQRCALCRHLHSFCFLVSFPSLKDHHDLHSLPHEQKRRRYC